MCRRNVLVSRFGIIENKAIRSKWEVFFLVNKLLFLGKNWDMYITSLYLFLFCLKCWNIWCEEVLWMYQYWRWPDVHAWPLHVLSGNGFDNNARINSTFSSNLKINHLLHRVFYLFPFWNNNQILTRMMGLYSKKEGRKGSRASDSTVRWNFINNVI